MADGMEDLDLQLERDATAITYTPQAGRDELACIIFSISLNRPTQWAHNTGRAHFACLQPSLTCWIFRLHLAGKNWCQVWHLHPALVLQNLPRPPHVHNITFHCPGPVHKKVGLHQYPSVADHSFPLPDQCQRDQAGVAGHWESIAVNEPCKFFCFLLIKVLRDPDGAIPNLPDLHYDKIGRLLPGRMLDDELIITGLKWVFHTFFLCSAFFLRICWSATRHWCVPQVMAKHPHHPSIYVMETFFYSKLSFV